MLTGQDPRLTAARPDLAAATLRGRVTAERFVDGTRCQVAIEIVDLKRKPRPDSAVDTQLLWGETVMVFEDQEGWSWVQADRDGYVGYVASSALGQVPGPPTHRVVVNRTFIYPAADMKQPILAALPLDGRLVLAEDGDDFVRIQGGGFVFSAHVAPLDQPARDYVAVAEQLAGAPYLWGGKSVGGIDCSGLVQLALAVAGRELPRDTDLQEAMGDCVPIDADLCGLRRGDLVFWKGHVGIMSDAETLLHANGHHMLVKIESLRAAQQRIAAVSGLPITSARRLNFSI